MGPEGWAEEKQEERKKAARKGKRKGKGKGKRGRRSGRVRNVVEARSGWLELFRTCSKEGDGL